MNTGPSDNSNQPSRTRNAMQGALKHRQSHRQRAHDQAHTESDAGDSGSGHSDSGVTVVTTNQQMAACVERLRAAGLFAFDTEFIGELTYRPQLCLVQVAAGEHVELIDPLAGQLDLSPLWKLLADESVVKVVHAGEQDLQHVWRFAGDSPRSIFDTQIAAGFVGLGASTSLAKLTLEITGRRIAKGFTLTDWSRRPLSNSQLRYAAEDVRSLCQIYRELSARIKQVGHGQWVGQECDLRCEQARANHDPGEAFHRVRGASSQEPRQQAIIKQLAAWREIAAQEADLPPRSLVRDEVLIELSRRVPTSPDRLAAIKGMPHPVVEHHASEIIRAISIGRSAPAVEPVASVENDDNIPPSEKFRLEALWGVAQCICAARGIDPTLVTNKKDFQDFVYKHTRNLPTNDLAVTQGWRSELLGGPLIEWMKAGESLKLKWNAGDGRIVAG